MRIGFLGLGKMGQGMARNLLAAGHELHVYNRSSEPARELAAAGARVAETPAEAARAVEIALTMLADDSATEKIVVGSGKEDGLIHGLPSGAIHVACSTISPALADCLSALHSARKQHYVSAPVFGRPEAAAAKKLWVVAGGPAPLIERCRPVFEAISQGQFIVGENPALANTIKLGGNFLIASMLESLAEAFALVRKAGGDEKRFLEVVNTALFKSPLYENYGGTMVSKTFEPAGFAMRLGLKDVRLTLAAADRVESPMPIASAIHDRMLTGVAQGHGEQDWSAIAKLAAEAAGLES